MNMLLLKTFLFLSFIALGKKQCKNDKRRMIASTWNDEIIWQQKKKIDQTKNAENVPIQFSRS